MPAPETEPQEPRSPPPLPGIFGIVAAFRFIRQGSPEIGAWALYLPAVGLGFGMVWLGVDRAAMLVTRRAYASLAVIAAAALLTRARPLLALGRLLAALPSRRTNRLVALESGRGALSCACTAAVVFTEVAVLNALDRYRAVGLACAPLLGCCSIVVLAVGSRAARTDGRRLKFAPAVTFREFGIATAATFAAVFWATDFLGLLLILATAACTIAARVGWHRWIGGVNETAVLATSEAIQCIVLALLVALS